jgi:hypothetical protein
MLKQMFVLKRNERMNVNCTLRQTRAMDGLLNMPNSGFVTRFQTSTASIHIMYHAQKTIVRFWF